MEEMNAHNGSPYLYGGRRPPYNWIVKYMAVAVAVAANGGGAAAVAGLTKRFFNHIQKDFLINVWGYRKCLFNLYRKIIFLINVS